VKTFAGVYGHQALYTRLHNEAFQNMSGTLVLGDILTRDETPSPRELDDLREQLRRLSAALTVEEQIGGALLDGYKRVLQR
jgi:hypothetical protein